VAIAIAMSDYLSVQEELTLTRTAAKEVRDQLLTLSDIAKRRCSVDCRRRAETPILPSLPSSR